MQLGVGVDSLCRPCPWEWTFFHRKCYYFSKCQRNWNDSVAACQEVDAQLVTVESDEEKTFLDVLLKNKDSAWMGLSDLKREGMWQWVDGSPLSDSFRKYWKKGQPNNLRNQDCVELTLKGWNDNNCDNKKFWICKKLETSCSSKWWQTPSIAPTVPNPCQIADFTCSYSSLFYLSVAIDILTRSVRLFPGRYLVPCIAPGPACFLDLCGMTMSAGSRWISGCGTVPLLPLNEMNKHDKYTSP